MTKMEMNSATSLLKSLKAPGIKRRLHFTHTTKVKHSEITKKTTKRVSLLKLTKRFVSLIQQNSDHIVDLKLASKALGVSHRRIYDITPVLQGIGLLTKRGVGKMRWLGGQFPGHVNNRLNLIRENEHLDAEESALDRSYQLVKEELLQLHANRQLAYVTASDLRHVREYEDQKIIAFKSPYGGTLSVPESITNLAQSEGLVMVQSSFGELEVTFLSSNNSQDQKQKQGSAHGGECIGNKQRTQNSEGPFGMMPVKKQRTSSFVIRDVLLSESAYNSPTGTDPSQLSPDDQTLLFL